MAHQMNITNRHTPRAFFCIGTRFRCSATQPLSSTVVKSENVCFLVLFWAGFNVSSLFLYVDHSSFEIPRAKTKDLTNVPGT